MTTTLRELLQAKVEGDNTERTSLVVQGGGMRGVYSMGALAHLERSGLRNAFDLVIGSSAGAINGAYLLAGQAPEAVRVYVDSLSNKHFVNLLRVSRMVDIDYMVDVALKQDCPLDTETLRDSPSILQVVLTDAQTGEARIVTNRESEYDIYEVIRATAALPALYNKQVPVGDRTYVDGGMADSVPLKRAIDAGSQRTVVVLTRPSDFKYKRQSGLMLALSRLMFRGQSQAVRNLFGTISEADKVAYELLELDPGDSQIYGVWPSDMTHMVERTTNDKALLEACALMGEQDMQKALDRQYCG